MGIQLISFLSLLTIFFLLELLIPKRPLSQDKPTRWLNNLSLSTINSLAIRVLLPIGLMDIALYCQLHNIGLLNNINIGYYPSLFIALISFDALIYGQHVIAHLWPPFWRLHQVHHTDVDMDTSTAIRFHVVEIIISIIIKAIVILCLGPSAISILLFEVLLNGMALFNHSNIAIPYKLDAYLRYLIVTPDMHRIHHSTITHETNSNYGFNLAIWDKLFNTYTKTPKLGHQHMTLGTGLHKERSLLTLLMLPFKSLKK